MLIIRLQYFQTMVDLILYENIPWSNIEIFIHLNHRLKSLQYYSLVI